MDAPIGESTAAIDTGNFECHICFELAREPVVTLCGHLYCWPCLYQWLQLHSHGHDCPICKAYLHDEEDLIPIYGRGKSVPDPCIPGRPTGRRPRTPRRADTTRVQENDWDPTDGFIMPMAAARLGHVALSTIFGACLPPRDRSVGGKSKAVALKFGLGIMCAVLLLRLMLFA